MTEICRKSRWNSEGDVGRGQVTVMLYGWYDLSQRLASPYNNLVVAMGMAQKGL